METQGCYGSRDEDSQGMDVSTVMSVQSLVA